MWAEVLREARPRTLKAAKKWAKENHIPSVAAGIALGVHIGMARAEEEAHV